jgi:hypothetical protein
MTDDSFEPSDKPTIWDLLILFVAPTILLVTIFAYPDSTKILEYEASNPTPATILGSNLAHRGIRHIIANIVGLWLIGGVSFVFACTCQDKRLYYFSFASYFVVLPFFADEFIRGMLEDTPELLNSFASVGFSLTIGALVGFLALISGLFVESNLDRQVSGLLISIGLFLSGFTAPFLNFGADNLALRLSILSGVIAISYILWRAIKALEDPISADSLHFVMAGLFIFYAAILMLFPKNVGGGFYGHMAGYIGGYLFPASPIFATRLISFLKQGWESIC